MRCSEQRVKQHVQRAQRAQQAQHDVQRLHSRGEEHRGELIELVVAGHASRREAASVQCEDAAREGQ